MGVSTATPAGARVVVLVAALAAALTARLGLWQLDRAAQKKALQAALDSAPGWPRLRTNWRAQHAPLGSSTAGRLRGAGWPTDGVPRQPADDGRPGFFVITPLQLERQRGAGAARLVATQQRRAHAIAPAARAGRGGRAGRIAPPPARLYEFAAAAASGPIRQNLDFGICAVKPVSPCGPSRCCRPTPRRPTACCASGPAPAGVHKHYGYAFQWFALGAL